MFNKNKSLKNLIGFIQDIKKYLEENSIQGVYEEGVYEDDYIESNILRCFSLWEHYFFDTRIKQEDKYLDYPLDNAFWKAKKMKLLDDKDIEIFKKNNKDINYNQKILSFLKGKNYNIEEDIDLYLKENILTIFNANIFDKSLLNWKFYYKNYIPWYEKLLIDKDGAFFRKTTRWWFSPGYKINVKPLYEKILNLIEPYALKIKSNDIDDLQEKIKIEIGNSKDKIYISFLHDLLSSNFNFEKFYDDTVLYFYERLDKSIAKDLNTFRKDYLIFVLANYIKKENLP